MKTTEEHFVIVENDYGHKTVFEGEAAFNKEFAPCSTIYLTKVIEKRGC